MSSDSFIHACAGGAGGMIAMTATYPLVSISMRAAVQTDKARHVGMLAAARRTLEEEGVQGLYSGLSSSLVGIGVTNFVYYFFFEKSRSLLLASKSRALAAANTGKGSSAGAVILAGGALTTAESMLAGLIAGCATSIISNPIWVINTRQTVRAPAPSAGAGAAKGQQAKQVKMGFWQTLSQIVQKDGVLALWRGIGPALVLVINPILQYTAFEQLKNALVKARAGRGVSVKLSDWDFFLLGALSKLFATGLTYPQIVIKSRQQSGSASRGNVWTAMTDIIEREGVSGLYRGISSKLLQSVATAGILFASKEQVFRAVSAVLEGRRKALEETAKAAAKAVK